MLLDLLTALMVLNGLVLGMCLLLLGAHHWLAREGTVTIKIDGDREWQAPSGHSLLSTLAGQKIFLPSACGGRGTCGSCRVQVLAGGGSVLATEQLVLSPADIKTKHRLACQVRVRRDLVVRVPAEALAAKEFQAVVSQIETVTDDIKKIVFKLIDPPTISFKPGQYVQICLRRPGEEPISRAYSIASSPSTNGIIELHVRLVAGGVMSTYLHSLEEGAPVVLSGPYGTFFQPEMTKTADRAIVCIAGGVGLAPLKSIIAALYEKPNDRQVYLFYGARTRARLYDHQTFVEMARRHHHFRYVPALSEEPADSDWDGHRGLITEIFAAVFPEGEPAEAYLCGPPAMIEALLPLLAAKGIQSEHIHFEKFML